MRPLSSPGPPPPLGLEAPPLSTAEGRRRPEGRGSPPPLLGAPLSVQESFALQDHGAGVPARGGGGGGPPPVPLGGPNTSELCMWSESHHHLDGIPRNPRNPHHLERVPGGSSVSPVRGRRPPAGGGRDRGGLGPQRQYSYALFLQQP
ncbi:unnamed protein product [Arctogadus glacialis]